MTVDVTSDTNDSLRFVYSASTLGIHVSYEGQFGPFEMIPVSRIDCPLALIPIFSQRIGRALWISVSFDHVSPRYNVIKKIVSFIYHTGRK